MRVLHGNHAVVRLRDIKIDDDQNITEDDNDPYPDTAGRSLHICTSHRVGSGFAEMRGSASPNFPNYRRSPLLSFLNNI